jgi:hypothetical protein
MRNYRVYFLDQGANIVLPPVDFECADNHEARKQTQALVDGRDAELWERDRLIGRFRRGKP